MFVQFKSKIKIVVQPKQDQHARRFNRKRTSTSLEHWKEATRVPNGTYIANLSVFFKDSWFRIFKSSFVPQLFSRQMKKSTLLWCWAHFKNRIPAVLQGTFQVRTPKETECWTNFKDFKIEKSHTSLARSKFVSQKKPHAAVAKHMCKSKHPRKPSEGPIFGSSDPEEL